MEVSEVNFKQEVLESQIPVLVDFWAEWCIPCRMVEPIVMEVAEKYDGRLKVVRLNVDKNQRLAVQYSIMSIPTLAVFVNGTCVDEIIGAVPKRVILSKLQKYITLN